MTIKVPIKANFTGNTATSLGEFESGDVIDIIHGGTNANTASDARTNLGLGDVDNVSAANLRDRSTHTGTQTLSTISDAGNMGLQNKESVNIDGGTIDGTAVNATTLTASGDVNFDSGTMFVDASTNRVGIGTSSPQSLFQINHTAQQGGAALSINRSDDTNANGSLLFRAQNTIRSGIGSNYNVGDVAGNLELMTGGNNTRMVVTSSGNVGIGTTSPAKRLDVNGEIRASTGILFGTDTAAVNTLDDYEEGTWTPAYIATGGGTTGTGIFFGYYTKVGNIVTCHGQIAAAKGTLSGDIELSGLPFTIKDIIGNGSTSLSGVYRWATDMPNLSFVPVENTTKCVLYKNATSADPQIDVTDADMINTNFRNVARFLIVYEV